MHRHAIRPVFLLSVLFLSVTTNVHARGGILDRTFNTNGKSVFNIESTIVSGTFADIAVIGGNKFLVTGRAGISGSVYYGVALSRFNSDGSLDTSFGSGGKIVIDAGITAEGAAIGVQSDGKIIVAAHAGNHPNRTTAVLRFTPDGELDTTFGDQGIYFSVMKVAKDVSILANNEIVIAGISDVPNLGRTQVLKLTPNGSPDMTFGNSGITSSTYFSGSDTDRMVIQSDGKIVVSGRNLFPVPSGLVHRFNPDGSPDMTFGTNGIREINLGTSMYPGGLVLQPDGKLVLAAFMSLPGSNTQILLTRLNSDGTTDGTFGGGGFVFRDLSPDYDRAHYLARTPDGKLVIAGQYDDNQAMLASFDSTGAVDTGFGTDGLLILPAISTSAIAVQGSDLIVTGGVSTVYLSRVSSAGSVLLFRNENYVSGRNDQALDVAIQVDGKVVTAGASAGGSGGTVASVARQNRDGSLDTSFGNGGRVTFTDGTNFSFVSSIAIQPDGKIVVAGQGSQATTFTYYSLFVARLNANGTLDSTFGTGGKVVITTPQNLIGYDMKIQSDGKIVVAGTVHRVVGDGIFDLDMIAARFNADGSLDAGFGGGVFMYVNGSAASLSTEEARTLVIQPDGKIILAGTHMLRLNPNSSIDSTFSPTPVPIPIQATDVKLQPDGKLLVSGSNSDFAIIRYHPNATIDTTFGVNGTASLDFGGVDRANAIFIDRFGDIVAGGSTTGGVPNRSKFALARFKPNGSPDTTFGAGGKVITDFGGPAAIYGLAQQGDGKIVAAGDAKLGLDIDYAVARYLSRTSPFDFDGDGRSDLSIFRPSAGQWWILHSSDGGNAAYSFGNSADKIVPADYTGDGRTDIAFFRPSSGEWFILRSEDGSYYSHPFGLSTDIPAPGDFDGDGLADQAVFRPSTGTWYIRRSSGGTTIQQFGVNGDVPVVADYDGDGIADIAIYRPASGQWWINRSSLGTIAFTFGNASDKPVQGDFTGDGKADAAFWRPSTGEWFVLRSENLSYFSFPFGTNGDVAAPGDFDGDGRHDATVFRPSGGTWYSQQSSGGTLIRQFGITTDRPVPGAFVP